MSRNKADFRSVIVAYTTPPMVTLKGRDGVASVVMLRFDKDLKKNGSIKSIDVKTAK